MKHIHYTPLLSANASYFAARSAVDGGVVLNLGSYRWHAAIWSGSSATEGRSNGTTELHTSKTSGQRGLNGQPGGTLRKSGGEPGIPAILRRGPRNVGNELSNP